MFTSSLQTAHKPPTSHATPVEAWPASSLDTSGVIVEELTTTAALESLQPEWDRLWSRSPRATPFQSPAWLLPWWRHVGCGQLMALAVHSCESPELVGLLL